MRGQTVILVGPTQRAYAHKLIDAAPVNAVVNIQAEKRSGQANNLFWSLVSDIARAKPQGRSLPTETWRSLLMSEAGFKPQFEVSLDGQGVVPIGYKSSGLRKAEFSELIAAAIAFGEQNGVKWTIDPHEEKRWIGRN